MLSCKDATALVSESLDHRLPTRQRLALRFHLLMCRNCSRFERQLHIIHDAVQWRADRDDVAPDLPAPALPDLPSQPDAALPDDARERITDAIERASTSN